MLTPGNAQCILHDVCVELARIIRMRVYTVFLVGNHQIYGHIRCVNMLLANPIHASSDSTQGPEIVRLCMLQCTHAAGARYF